jgi:hypothetical protein
VVEQTGILKTEEQPGREAAEPAPIETPMQAGTLLLQITDAETTRSLKIPPGPGAPEFKALQDREAYFVGLLKRKICSPRPARHARRSPAQFFAPA